MTIDSVVTRMTFDAPAERLWAGLKFYEQILERPPLPLRILLPVPIRTEGRKAEVGDEATCVYEGGLLVKRVTKVEQERHYGFVVVSQDLVFGGGMRLKGGCYNLRAMPKGGTEVALETRYWSPKRPRWFWKPIESAVCHAFHRHILGALKR